MPSSEVGQSSFFQEDFSHILQEHGFNEFVNLLGIADHTHFNTFQSLPIDAERSCSTNPELDDKFRTDFVKDQNSAWDVSDTRTADPAVYLPPNLCTGAKTAKKSRDTSPDRIDFVASPVESAFVGAEAKRRRLHEPQLPTAEEGSISGGVRLECSKEFFPLPIQKMRINRIIRSVPQDRPRHGKSVLSDQELRMVQLF